MRPSVTRRRRLALLALLPLLAHCAGAPRLDGVEQSTALPPAETSRIDRAVIAELGAQPRQSGVRLLEDNALAFAYRAATAEAAGSKFHTSLYHTASDDSCCFGRFIWHLFGPNEVQTMCSLYNASSSLGNPASRAGDFMHEGWHAWLDKYDWDNGSCGGHRCGTPGNCTATDACDYFYFHGVGAYAFGAMYQTDGTANRFHSPNQVQVEFLCDVADYPKAWVPASVRQAARADANARAVTRFINGPGYQCGNPRPW